VDHAADKGLLYLKKPDVQAVTGKYGLTIRPHSLADPDSVKQIKDHLDRNVTATRRGLVLAYAFDDEISLGSYVIPCDVDSHRCWFLSGRAGGNTERLRNRPPCVEPGSMDEISSIHGLSICSSARKAYSLYERNRP
jgi:hypothetical protein